MKNILVLVLFLFLTSTAYATVYDGQWHWYNQTVYKGNVYQAGWYRWTGKTWYRSGLGETEGIPIDIWNDLVNDVTKLNEPGITLFRDGRKQFNSPPVNPNVVPRK